MSAGTRPPHGSRAHHLPDTNAESDGGLCDASTVDSGRAGDGVRDGGSGRGRCAPGAARAFDLRVPWLSGWRPWALGIGLAATLAVLFVADYRQGRLLYASGASYHAYLEFPVLLALLFGATRRRPPE